MVRHAVVPDGDIVGGPFEADLEVVIFGDVPEEVVEQQIGLLGV